MKTRTWITWEFMHIEQIAYWANSYWANSLEDNWQFDILSKFFGRQLTIWQYVAVLAKKHFWVPFCFRHFKSRNYIRKKKIVNMPNLMCIIFQEWEIHNKQISGSSVHFIRWCCAIEKHKVRKRLVIGWKGCHSEGGI